MNKFPKQGSITLKQEQLIGLPYTSQMAYTLLQDRGAPIIGWALKELDLHYRWYVDTNLEDMTVTYRWKLQEG